MAGLADFRAKHPEYDSVDDTTLADALHRKFYANVPKEQFLAKLGLGAPPPNDVPPAGDMSQWQQTPPGLAPSVPTFGEDLAGGAAATAKGVVKGATAIPGMLADAPFQVANLFGANQQLPSQSQSAMLDQAFGDTSGYQSVENIANAATGAVVPAAMAGRAAQGASATVAPMLEAAAAAPGTQMVAGVTGEGGRQLAEAGGMGAVGQTAAALAGGMAGVMAPQALGDLGRGAGRALYRSTIESRINPDAQIGRALLDNADGEGYKLAEALRNHKNVLPGSEATASEAATAAGLVLPEFSALDEATAASIPRPRALRDAARREARLAPFDDITGTPEYRAQLDAELAQRGEAYEAVNSDVIDPRSVAQEREQIAQALRRRQADALQLSGKFDTDAAQQRTLAEGGGLGAPESNVGSEFDFAYPREGVPPNIPQRGPAPERAPGFVRSDDMPGSAFPVRGQPRVPPRYTENIQRVPEAQDAAAETKALAGQLGKQAAVTEKYTDLAREAGFLNEKGLVDIQGQPAMQDAMKYAGVEAGDTITVGKAQAMKEFLDKAVNRSEQTAATETGVPKYRPKELEDLRKSLVSWLKARSPAWDEARQGYKETATKIDRTKVGAALRDKLEPAGSADKPLSHSALAKALRDPAKTIKGATGSTRYDDYVKLLPPEQVDAVRAVEQDMANEINNQQLAARGRGGENVGAGTLKTSPSEAIGRVKLPQFLSWKATIVNDLMRRVGISMDKKMAERLADLMLDPQRTGIVVEKALRDAEGAKRLAAGLRYGRSARASAAGSMAGNVGTNGE
jgi:hypothetical protein